MTPLQVGQLIYDLLLNKSPGRDQISVIKDCKSHITDHITNLINCSFSSNSFPKAWKVADVIPVPKNKQGCNNRPISQSIAYSLSKLCERVAHLQMSVFLMENNKLTNHQSGNRKLHSTETLNIFTTNNILNKMDKKNLTAMILV